MGFWSSLGKGLLNLGTGGVAGTVMDVAGAGLGAISQSEASNRGTKLGAQMDLERLLMGRDLGYQDMRMSREQEGRASGADAWRRLLAAQHTISPGARPQLSPYSIAPRQATGAERQGADAMTQEVMARLLGGNPIPQVQERPMQIDTDLMNPGWLERLTGYAAPALSAYGRLRQPSRGGDV